jgi:hypothetical protein
MGALVSFDGVAPGIDAFENNAEGFVVDDATALRHDFFGGVAQGPRYLLEPGWVKYANSYKGIGLSLRVTDGQQFLEIWLRRWARQNGSIVLFSL